MINFLLRPFIQLTFNARGAFGFTPIPFSIPTWIVIGIILTPNLLLTKLFIQSDFFKNIWPFTPRKNQRLKTELNRLLNEKSASLITRPKNQMPVLSYETINQLTRSGFLPIQDSTQKIHSAATNSTYSFSNNEFLGKGAFGVVYLGQDIATGSWVAIKKQRSKSLADEQKFLIEAKYLLEQNQLLGYQHDDKNKCFYTIMPLFAKDVVRSSSPIVEKIEFALESAKSIKNLHDKRRIHNDLHLGNICWDKSEKKCHLIDYGSMTKSDHLDETSSYEVARMPYHAPPEFHVGMMNFKSGDVYAFGCILASLFPDVIQADKEFSNFIKGLQHSLWFMRPTMQDVIHFLQKNKQRLISINDVSNTNNDAVKKSYEEINRYTNKVNSLEIKIAQAKNIAPQNGFLRLSLLNKKKAIYNNYISDHYSHIEFPSMTILKTLKNELVANKTKFELFVRAKIAPHTCHVIELPPLNHNSFLPGLDLSIKKGQSPVNDKCFKKLEDLRDKKGILYKK